MRLFILSLITLSFTSVLAQSLSIDFENDITTADFIDFDGGSAEVVANPYIDENNASATVAKIVRNGGQIWAGSKIDLEENLDFSMENAITMKVYSTAPIGTIMKFKLEGNGTTERDVMTSVTSEWETLTWDFTGVPADFNSIVFMFDFGNVGNGSESSTFYFDDVARLFGGLQIDFPVDFEDPEVNYTMSDFGGNVSSLVKDPTDTTNAVIKAIKTDQAATWAGTTIGTPAGFATNIPLTLSDSKMYVRVWSPKAGTPIRLKVEDSDDPTHTCETETNTTVSEEWEMLEFDFLNQAPGTEFLSIGLDMGWTYNMASIFFNFGTEGSVAGEKTYYFDDVWFGEPIISSADNFINRNLTVSPNPTLNSWTITNDRPMQKIEMVDMKGSLILTHEPKAFSTQVDASNLQTGIYFVRVWTLDNLVTTKLVKQ